MSTTTPTPDLPVATDPPPWQEPPAYPRRKFLAVMGGFGLLAAGAAVLGGDLLCRTVLPGGLPVGIVTAAIGGPFLIYLMVVMSRKASV